MDEKEAEARPLMGTIFLVNVVGILTREITPSHNQFYSIH